MSWYQRLAGTGLALSDKARKRIGVTGYGVDDVGILRHPKSVATVLRVGQHVGAIDSADINRFVSMKHGSSEQLERAERLSSVALRALGETIDRRVSTKLEGMGGVGGDQYKNFIDWAEGNGWEYAVGCIETDYGTCFCLTDDVGLSVFECPVARLAGHRRDLATTLVHVLVDEALKMPAHCAIEFAMTMGADAGSLCHQQGFEALRKADDATVLKFIEENDSELYQELGFWDEDPDAMRYSAAISRDIAFAHYDESSSVKRILGDEEEEDRESGEGILKRMATAAEKAKGDPIAEFVRRACEALTGDSRAELMAALPTDERFELMPGRVALVDYGFHVEAIEDRFYHLHELSMNGEEVAYLPLEGPVETTIALLERITVAERLLLGLGAVINEQQCLSEKKAA